MIKDEYQITLRSLSVQRRSPLASSQFPANIFAVVLFRILIILRVRERSL
ncbi:MAG: hypothetical protein QNJ55_18370 [Xenococcus sp. MO_188.B8]|nr:hypothetical protein [Xenococcus sp. MO_188.B8]